MLYSNQFDLPFYIKRFLRHIEQVEKKSPDTVDGYGKDLKKFTEFLYQEYCGNLLTEEIDKADIRGYLAELTHRGLKTNSINRHLSSIKSFYKYLVIEEDFRVDVGAKIKLLPKYEPIPDVLDEDEIKTFLNTTKNVSSFYHALFTTLYHTGSRITPVRTLKKENVDLKNRTIYFPKVKFGGDQLLPMNDTLYDVLGNFLLDHKHDGSLYVFRSPKFINKPISISMVRLEMRKFGKAAGIDKHVYPHMLRHCTATHLTLKGVDEHKISIILNHKDPRSTKRYQHLKTDDYRDSLNILST